MNEMTIVEHRSHRKPSRQAASIRNLLLRIAHALTLPGLASHGPRGVLVWLSLEPTLRDSAEFGLAKAEQPRTGQRQPFCWRIH
jgi:hypothetical protein